MANSGDREMDSAVISAISGLAGAMIGGATSAASSILGERVKDRRNAANVSWKRREHLYNQFIEAAASKFADALSHERDDAGSLMELYALVAKMRLISPHPVVAAAEAATINVQAAYEAPNRSLRQIHIFSADHDVDPLLAFSEACREDLEISREGSLR
jgi:hypothetical protein